MSDRPEALSRIISRAIDHLGASIESYCDRAPGDSPIEKLFITALYAQTAYPNTAGAIPLIFGQNGNGPAPDVRKDALYVVPQFTVRGRRVDYVIFAHDGHSWKRILIECDGHDFHERTKEQATADRKQDRIFQASGEEIYRFTGWEIVNEPDRCAYEVLRWADRITVCMGEAV